MSQSRILIEYGFDFYITVSPFLQNKYYMIYENNYKNIK